jgi:hypothetical protein
LTKLELNGVELGDGTLFSTLAAQAACPLSSISLRYCNIKETAVGVAATALAQLPSLKACHVQGGSVPLCIASQLTALTSLEGGLEARVPPPNTQLVKAVSRNKGLQSLSVGFNASGLLSAEMLQCLLNSCTNLTELDLQHHQINDQGLDILLQHGTNISRLTLSAVHITRSRADSTCRWQRLRFEHSPDVLAGLAYLPLRSVQELETFVDAGTLHLQLTPSPQLIPLLQQAVSNLKGCPAWQKQPAGRILFYTFLPETFSGAQKLQLFSALSPLGGPHLQHLGIAIKGVEYGPQVPQVLASSLGSTLKSLSLHRGIVKPSFWPALSQHLPRLRKLGFAYKVHVSTEGMIAYLHTVAQPFTLCIGPGVLPDQHIADLADSINAPQLQGISLKLEPPNDDLEFMEVGFRRE